MGNRTELSDAQKRAIAWIHAQTAKDMGAIGIEIGKMLAELTAELADAQSEKSYWRACYEATKSELKVLATIAITHAKTDRLVVTRKELSGIPPQTELIVEKPEDGVRIYRLRRKEPDDGRNHTRQ